MGWSYLCIGAFSRSHALYVDINQFLRLLQFLNSSVPFWTLNQAIKCQDLKVAVLNLVILDNCYLEWLLLIPPTNHSSATHRALYRVNYEENFAGGFYYFDPVRRHYNHLKSIVIFDHGNSLFFETWKSKSWRWTSSESTLLIPKISPKLAHGCPSDEFLTHKMNSILPCKKLKTQSTEHRSAWSLCSVSFNGFNRSVNSFLTVRAFWLTIPASTLILIEIYYFRTIYLE